MPPPGEDPQQIKVDPLLHDPAITEMSESDAANRLGRFWSLKKAVTIVKLA